MKKSMTKISVLYRNFCHTETKLLFQENFLKNICCGDLNFKKIQVRMTSDFNFRVLLKNKVFKSNDKNGIFVTGSIWKKNLSQITSIFWESKEGNFTFELIETF